MNISLFIMIISGDINILVETKAMECGIRALNKMYKRKRIFAFCTDIYLFYFNFLHNWYDRAVFLLLSDNDACVFRKWH